MIELADGVWIAPEHVTMVKKINEGSCLLYFVGEGALDGHVLPYEASDVVEVVDEALYGDDEEEEDDEQE